MAGGRDAAAAVVADDAVCGGCTLGLRSGKLGEGTTRTQVPCTCQRNPQHMRWSAVPGLYIGVSSSSSSCEKRAFLATAPHGGVHLSRAPAHSDLLRTSRGPRLGERVFVPHKIRHSVLTQPQRGGRARTRRTRTHNRASCRCSFSPPTPYPSTGACAITRPTTLAPRSLLLNPQSLCVVCITFHCF